MFKTKRARPEESRQDAPANTLGSKIDEKQSSAPATPAGPGLPGLGLQGLKSKVPQGLAPKRRQTAPPDGATIRQQFERVRRYAAEPSGGIALQPGRSVAEDPSRLLIGRGISFKGRIADCDSLIVEGKVAAITKCRALQIQEAGVYDGEIEAETADVCGRVEGRIRVRGRLTIRAAGRVNGDVTYGELDISVGGRLSGDVRHAPVAQATAKDGSAAASDPAPPSQPVAPEAAEKAPSGLPDPSDVGPQARPPSPVAAESSTARDDIEQASASAPRRDPAPIAARVPAGRR